MTDADRRGEFVAWQHQVDLVIEKATGLSSSDLADQTWWSWFTAEMPPAEAARLALAAKGFELPSTP